MRIAICLSVLLLSLVAAGWSVTRSLAAEQLQAGAEQLWALRKQQPATGKYPTEAALTALESTTAKALGRAPDFGELWLQQVLIARTYRELPNGSIVENIPLALDAARQAVVHRPQSPVAWAEYAVLADLLLSQQRWPEGTAGLQRLMRRALALGPRETNMQLVMLDLGLRNWDDLEPSTREALSRAVGTFNQVNKRAALGVALRRGRDRELCDLAPLRGNALCVPAVPVSAPIEPAPGVNQ